MSLSGLVDVRKLCQILLIKEQVGVRGYSAQGCLEVGLWTSGDRTQYLLS
jgi:hypothetical protein